MSTLNPSPRKTRRWERRKKARPQELLIAALESFVEHGFVATSMEDVAKRAGVAKGTLYLYFPSKDDLFKAVIREKMLPILGGIETVIDNFEGDSVSLFREIVLGWWEQSGNFSSSGISRLMLTEACNFPELAKFYHDEVVLRCNEIIGRVLRRGVERDEFRKLDTPHLTEVIVAPMIMLMILGHSFGADRIKSISPTAYLDHFIDLCMHGLLRSKGEYMANS